MNNLWKKRFEYYKGCKLENSGPSILFQMAVICILGFYFDSETTYICMAVLIRVFIWYASVYIYLSKFHDIELKNAVKHVVVHESGHTLVAWYLNRPITKVEISPSIYYNLQEEKTDSIGKLTTISNSMHLDDFNKAIIVLAGYIAEKLILDKTIFNGHEDDVKKVFRFISHVVIANNLDLLYVSDENNIEEIDMTLASEKSISRFNELFKDAFYKSRKILVAHDDLLHKLFHKLEKKNSLNSKELEVMFSGHNKIPIE